MLTVRSGASWRRASGIVSIAGVVSIVGIVGRHQRRATPAPSNSCIFLCFAPCRCWSQEYVLAIWTLHRGHWGGKQLRGVDVLEAVVVVVEGPAAAEALDGLVDAVVGGLCRAVMMSMSF